MVENTREVVIKVVSVGGGGGNALDNMIRNASASVEYIALNTDIQALEHSMADEKNRIVLGDKKDKTRGQGAGARPEIGKKAAEASLEEIVEKIKDADMIFITAGMGGGTGTGAAPVVAKAAKQLGILTIAVVTTPFNFEGKFRKNSAMKGIEELRNSTDSLIVIDNNKVLSITTKKMGVKESFKLVDDVLARGVSAIHDIIEKPGYINLDGADVRTIFQDSGRAIMGVGECTSADEEENSVMRATEMAINSPLQDATINGARRVILNFTSREEVAMNDIASAADMIFNMVSPDANIIWGATLDNNMEKGAVKVTVIATDFPDNDILTTKTVAAEDMADVKTKNQSIPVIPNIKSFANPSKVEFINRKY